MDLKNQLAGRLDYVDASREERLRMAVEIARNPQWVPALVQVSLEDHGAIGSRACWVLEYCCNQDLRQIYPCLEEFGHGLSGLRSDSSIRPVAKICEMLVTAYYQGSKANRPPLDGTLRERMTAACFDWLIGPYKVAAKAFSMQALFLLGSEEPWIRDELRAVLEQNYHAGSAGYQARARRILGMLDKPG